MPEVALETQNLTRRYGSLIAVQDLSLQIYAGDVFGFLGPNGAGKTTSINLMCGLLAPNQGRVLLHGKPIRNGDPAARQRVGVCPQNIVLWERLTCVEQLVFIGQMYSLPAHRAQASADRLLKDLDLLEKANQLARTLSGGMQRRLNLAMALVHDPEIVVLDEPEAGLDPQSRVRVREYIQSLARKKTVILTTHNMDEADRLADRVAIIDHGRLLVVDTPERLKQSLGEGDVIEIHLAGQAGENTLAPLMANLGPGLSYESEGGLLRLRLSNAASRLPALLETLQTAGLQPGEISIRQKSLEDVFIQLTGRTLRE